MMEFKCPICGSRRHCQKVFTSYVDKKRNLEAAIDLVVCRDCREFFIKEVTWDTGGMPAMYNGHIEASKVQTVAPELISIDQLFAIDFAALSLLAGEDPPYKVEEFKAGSQTSHIHPLDYIDWRGKAGKNNAAPKSVWRSFIHKVTGGRYGGG